MMTLGGPNMETTDLRKAVATESIDLSGNSTAITNPENCSMTVNANLCSDFMYSCSHMRFMFTLSNGLVAVN